jgi:pyruvate,water dikinase
MFKFLRRFLKEEDDEQVRLRGKFEHFRRLLDHNNQALEIMADLEEKFSGDFLFDTGYLFAQVEHLGASVSGMVAELNRMTQDAYQELTPICRRLVTDIQEDLARVPEIPVTPLILPLDALNREWAGAVGGKMANLGELKNRLRLSTPEGFAVSAFAYKHFLESTGLAAELETRLAQARIDDLDSLEAVSQDIQALVRQASLPTGLEGALQRAALDLGAPFLAVRSSAVGEDTEISFAGQFVTLLNVKAEQLPEHYKEVVAGKFSSQAIFYWKYQGFSVNEVPMAVGCVVMVPARASGVMFSLDPHAPEEQTVLISGVWGLGPYAVSGAITPDIFTVSREAGRPIRRRQIAAKPAALVCRPEGGVMARALSEAEAASPCLTDDQVRTLAAIAMRLEEHFGAPQDIEWALDDNGNLMILQSRPLRIASQTFGVVPREHCPASVTPLLDVGLRAVGGVAAGPVHLFSRDDDVQAIPEGAVVVARQPVARLVLAMPRLAAIVTERGNPTDHMSILAREFRVPTLVDVTDATKVLQPGQMVTVDADLARIYPGVLTELLESRPPVDETLKNSLLFRKLKKILQKTVPLNLLDPESPEFQATNCRTPHDITRFCHEKAMDAMFSLDVERAVEASGVCRLKTDLPLNLFILDLGGGLGVQGQALVPEADILCRPFLALLKGFHHPRVSWAGQVAMDLKGFISVFANTLYDMNKTDRGLGGKSFAILTDRYLNFNSRLGYHFGLVDAFITPERNDNYITFQFKGGAANPERRERRARLLKNLLDDLGFNVMVKGDLVQGRLIKFSEEETEAILERLGVIIAFSRQLDLALVSEAVLDRCLDAFRSEDYSLSCLRPEA